MSLTPLSIRQASERYPAFSEHSLRHLVAKAEANGLADYRAIQRKGRKIIVIAERFELWVGQEQKMKRHAATWRKKT